jgi:alginate O-acetyltransferase complex protein AlgI
MLLGGLWHGAALHYVVWGGLHGAMLALERARGRRALWAAAPPALQTAACFAFTTFAWVFFRAADVPAALAYLGAMVGLSPVRSEAALLGGVIHQPYYLLSLAVAAVITWGGVCSWDWTRQLGGWKALLCCVLLWLACAALSAQSFNPFIYFIF